MGVLGRVSSGSQASLTSIAAQVPDENVPQAIRAETRCSRELEAALELAG